MAQELSSPENFSFHTCTVRTRSRTQTATGMDKPRPGPDTLSSFEYASILEARSCPDNLIVRTRKHLTYHWQTPGLPACVETTGMANIDLHSAVTVLSKEAKLQFTNTMRSLLHPWNRKLICLQTGTSLRVLRIKRQSQEEVPPQTLWRWVHPGLSQRPKSTQRLGTRLIVLPWVAVDTYTYLDRVRVLYIHHVYGYGYIN